MSVEKIAQRDKTIYKHNFIDLIKAFVPEFYIDEDIQLSGVENDRLYEFLEQLVLVVGDLSSHIYVSGHTTIEEVRPLFSPDSVYATIYPDEAFKLFKLDGDFDIGAFSDLTVAEIIKTYELPSIKAAEEFTPRRDLRHYIATTLRKFPLNSPSASYLSGVESSITNQSEAHEYMYNNYGWLYVLNTNEAFDAYSKYKTPRDYLIDQLILTVLDGIPFTLANGISAFLSYIWNSRVL